MLLRAFLLLVMIGAVGSLVYVVTRDSPSNAIAAPVPEPHSTSVLVAARPLTSGTLLREGDVRWEKWALADAPEGYFMRGRSKEEEVVGSVIRRAFTAGEPLMAGQIVAPGERGFLAVVLKPGMRAVAVAVDLVSAASGLIWPGDRVDVLLTQTFRIGDLDARKASGETVLRDIRVLAIDQRLGEATGAQAGQAATERQGPRTVTLEVTPQQGETLRVAASLGSLALSLRSVGSPEEEAAGSTGQAPVWASDVSAALRGHEPPAPGKPQARGIEIVRGTRASALKQQD